jgi:hypothetical protein
MTTSSGTGPPPIETSTAALTSSSFTVDPDIGAGGGGLRCSAWDQECPDGEKCMPWANDGGNQWNATRCSELDPEAAGAGDACTVADSPVRGQDTCDEGSMCIVGDADALEGECVALCTGAESDPVCPPPTTCHISNEGVLILCLEPCDPLALDCGPGRACVPGHNDTFHCFVEGAALPLGAVCGQPLQSCADGMACVDADFLPACDDDFCCAQLCDLTAFDPDAACVDPEATCVSWWPDETPPVDMDHVGVCRLLR